MSIDKQQIKPSNGSYLPLQDVCEIIGGSQPSKEYFSYEQKPGYIRLIQIQDYKSDKHKTYIPESLARRFCTEDDVMIGRYGPPIFQILRGLKGAYNVALMKASPKNEKILDKEYLYYFLQNKTLLNYVISNSSRTAGQDGVRKELLDDYPIILPSLAEQKRIAAVLEKCDRLRRTRRYALQLSETFLQSVFLEMFGNENNLKRKTLNEICLKVFDCKHYTPPYVSEGIPLIRTNDVEPGFFKFGSTVYVSIEEYEKLTDVNRPGKGDIVFAREGSFGIASYINENYQYAIGQRMMLLRADPSKINPIYLTYFINSPPAQEYLLKVSMGTTVKRVNVSDVKDLTISLPPLHLQEKFAQIVQKFERFRTQQREAERQAEHLFQTLLHRAFRGELTSDNLDEKINSSLTTQINLESQTPTATAEKLHQSTTKTAPSQPTQHPDTEIIQLTLPGLD